MGQHRDALDVGELYLLKQRYGLSMQAWIHRAYDLRIISKGLYRRTFELFTQKGWRQREPGDPYPSETSTRMKRLVLGALAEGVISQSRAAQLLAMPLSSLRNLEAIAA